MKATLKNLHRLCRRSDVEPELSGLIEFAMLHSTQSRRSLISHLYGYEAPDGWRCSYCGGNVDHFDHIPPIATAHRHPPETWHMTPCCDPCNRALGAIDRTTIKEGREIIRRQTKRKNQ